MAEESNNSQSDAYDEMRRSPESDRTPGFLEGKKNNSNKSSKKQKRSDARDNAQGELNDFEADAANQGEEGGF